MIVVGLSLSHQFQRLDITDRRWTNLKPWPPRAPRDVIRTAIDTRRNRIVRGLDGILERVCVTWPRRRVQYLYERAVPDSYKGLYNAGPRSLRKSPIVYPPRTLHTCLRKTPAHLFLLQGQQEPYWNFICTCSGSNMNPLEYGHPILVPEGDDRQ